VDGQARGLVHDEHGVVLVDDANLERLRLERRRGERRPELDALAAGQAIALGPRLAVDDRVSGLHEALGRRSRADFREPGQEAVEPPARGLCRNQESDQGRAVEAPGRLPGLRSASTMEARSSATPMTMQLSARLNAGQ
jgi:hypothetical protein